MLPLPATGNDERRQSVHLPMWHKDNREFWYIVGIVISVVFTLVYRSVRNRIF